MPTPSVNNMGGPLKNDNLLLKLEPPYSHIGFYIASRALEETIPTPSQEDGGLQMVPQLNLSGRLVVVSTGVLTIIEIITVD